VKLRTHLQRLLLFVGFALLAFYAAAKLHEQILSRAGMRHFEDQNSARLNQHAEEKRAVPTPTSSPDFVSWSKRRMQQYVESLSEHVASPLAVIRIDRIHVEAPVLEGTDDLTLNRGVGHISGTALFGGNGNIGIAGHRDGFFRGLKDITVGDRIERLEIVDPKNVSVLRPSNKPALTLVTCYPFYFIGKAPQRFIVHAVPIGAE
jgi:sortase A